MMPNLALHAVLGEQLYERRMVAFDDFNYAGTSLIGGSGGKWTNNFGYYGGYNISGGHTTGGNEETGSARYAASSFLADQYSRVILYSTPSGYSAQRGSVTARISDSNDDGPTNTRDAYHFVFSDDEGSNASVYLKKCIDGAFTTLASGVTLSIVAGDALEIRCQGTRITCLHNDKIIYSVHDESLATGRPGIGGVLNGGGAWSFESWEGGNIVPVTPNVPLLPVRKRGVRTTQPQGPCEIDWSNPLTRGLVFAYVPTAGPRDLLGVTPKYSSTADYRADSSVLVQGDGTGEIRWMPSTDSNGLQAVLFDRAVLTAMTLARQVSAQNTNTVFCRMNGAANFPWAVGLHGGTYNGPIAYMGSFSFTPSSTLFDTTKKYRLVTLTSDGTTARLYADATEYANGAIGTVTYQYGGVGGEWMGKGVRTGSIDGADWRTRTALNLFWTRTLSPEEVARVASNPWQLFKSRNRIMVAGVEPAPKSLTVRKVHRTRTTQPQGPCEIDRSNPLTRGLVFADLPATAQSFVASVTTAPKIEARMNRSVVGGTYLTRVPVISPANGFTFIGGLVFPSAGGGRVMGCTGIGQGWRFETSAANLLFTFGGVANYGTTAVGSYFESANEYGTMIQDVALTLSGNGGTIRFFRKGVFTEEFAVGTYVTTTDNLDIGPVQASHRLVWNRKLSDAEVLQVYQNPWQLFTGGDREFSFEEALSQLASQYPTLSLAQLINILTTQATPRVTITVP